MLECLLGDMTLFEAVAKPLGQVGCRSAFWEAQPRLWLPLSLGGSVEALECLLGGMALFAAAEVLGGSVEVLECLMGGMTLLCGSPSPWGLSRSAGVSLGRHDTV